MTFLEVVNRMFVINAIIRGDTDAIQSFSDVAHNASMNVARLAVQDELTSLIADRLIPSERQTSGAITTVAGQRTYDVAADFIRFYGTAQLYSAQDNIKLFEYPGGLEKLQLDDYEYATANGEPNWWYWEPTSTKKIGLHQIPQSVKTWTYDYEGSVLVTDASDTLPFHNNEESYSFTGMCARRFKYMFEDAKSEADIVSILEKDRTYIRYKATLASLIRGTNPGRKYSFVYI